MNRLIDGDPQRIGRYWLAGRLGSGGQGVVYEGYSEEGRRVAVKVLHGDKAAQLAREVEAARRVAAFCTAALLEADLDGPRPYLVSEYVEGPSLRQAVASGRRFRDGDLHRLAAAIATALTAIHDAGVVHRDLKPDNVLLGPDGPRVIDFGIARTAEMSLTTTGLVTGTPTYMAPEVFTGQRAGAPADVFAWGGVLLYAATGADPFEAESLGGVMHRVLSMAPDLAVLPASVRPLVAAALGKEPGDRPTARELLMALVSGDRLDTVRLLAEGGREAAGIAGDLADPALGTLAEDAYRLLGPAERDLVPEVFLRLVTTDARGELTVRPTALSELNGDPQAVERVLEVFSYLLARSGQTVELARPALPHAWPRYRRWIAANREGLAVHGEIRTAAQHWQAAGRRDGDLLHGSRLENALRWAATARRDITLSPAERDFLDGGAALARKRAGRSRLAALSLGGLLVIALAAGGLALHQGGLADERAARIGRQLRAAEGDRLANAVATVRRTDPRLSMLLSAAAWRLSPTPYSRAALTASLAQRETRMFRDPAEGADTLRTMAENGRTLASVGEDEVRLWDLRTERRSGGFRGLGLGGEQPLSIALSASGRTLVATTTTRAVAFDTGSGKRLREVRFTRPVDPEDERVEGKFAGERTVVFSTPAGPTRWNLATGAYGLDRTAGGATFSADGRWRAVEGKGEVLWVTDRRTGARAHLGRLDGAGTQGNWSGGSPVFGTPVMATVDYEGIQLWRTSDSQLMSVLPVQGDLEGPPEGAFDGSVLRYRLTDQVFSADVSGLGAQAGPDVNWAELSQDGRSLATDTPAGGASVGPARGEGATTKVPEAQGAAFGGGGLSAFFSQETVTVVDSGTKHVFDIDRGDIGDGVFSPDGSLLAITAVRGATGFVQVWDWRAKRPLWDADHQGDDHRLAFSPDGGRLAVGARQVTLVDARTGKPVAEPFGGGGLDHRITGLHFSPSGDTLTVMDSRLRLGLWDTATLRSRRTAVTGIDEPHAHSPSENVAAGTTQDGRAALFDVSAGVMLGPLPDPHGGEDPYTRARSMAFTADGSEVLVVNERGVVTAHPVAPAKVLAAVCARAGRTLSEAEWRAHVSAALPYERVCP
ncbi:WD40 repeat domain-containing serine/threonine protein kinase [Nonomuraea longicatena]|uniref:Protein kinase domain-containing protein n=1 Tax=Nonomuraea longicatena TaxID=83682 RepID=A0ABP4BSJ0_9ACTN